MKIIVFVRTTATHDIPEDEVLEIDNVAQVAINSDKTMEIIEGYNSRDRERSKRVTRIVSYDSFLVSA